MTQATPVSVRRVEGGSDLETDIQHAEKLAKLLDTQFEVAGIKFGLDAILGLVPVAGDAITTTLGLYPVMLARKHNLGRVVIGRMMLNLGVDFALGAVPLVGDVLDVMRKANMKNLALLKKAAEKRRGGAILMERREQASKPAIEGNG